MDKLTTSERNYDRLKSYTIKRLPSITEAQEKFLEVFTSPEFLRRICTLGEYRQETLERALQAPARYSFTEAGGSKRRSLLCSLVNGLVSGEKHPYKHIDILSAIVEAPHRGTLVIDDIQDETKIRNKRRKRL